MHLLGWFWTLEKWGRGASETRSSGVTVKVKRCHTCRSSYDNNNIVIFIDVMTLLMIIEAVHTE